LGLLSRNRVERSDPVPVGSQNFADMTARLSELDQQVRSLASRLDAMDDFLKKMPNASDFRLVASDIARVAGDLERIEQKNKEGMLVLYAQVYKELKAIRGDRVVEMVDMEPGDGQNGDKAEKDLDHLDQLSQLARNWRKMRAQPAVQEE